MRNLPEIKDKTLDRIVTRIKGWVNSQNDTDLKSFLKAELSFDKMSMNQMVDKYESHMEGLIEESASLQLMNFLEEGEIVTRLTFGEASNIATPEIGEGLQKRLFRLSQAEPLLYGWLLEDPRPNAPTYKVRIWTNKRVIWNKINADGSTKLEFVYSHPVLGEF